MSEPIEIDEWCDPGQSNFLYFARGHHPLDDFRRNLADYWVEMGTFDRPDADEQAALCSVTHAWYCADRAQDADGICYRPAQHDTPGAFPVTITEWM